MPLSSALELYRLRDCQGWQHTPKPAPTLAEYLASLQAQDEANSATLRGEILNPDFAFDFRYPICTNKSHAIWKSVFGGERLAI
jgi:hypothetical protein